MPGDCSPSRSVVSKMITLSLISGALSLNKKTSRAEGTRGWRYAYWALALHKQEDGCGTHVAKHGPRLRRSRQAVRHNERPVRRVILLVLAVVGVGFVVVR